MNKFIEFWRIISSTTFIYQLYLNCKQNMDMLHVFYSLKSSDLVIITVKDNPSVSLSNQMNEKVRV